MKVLSAKTTNPNTAETDLLPKVWHTVQVQLDGGEIREIQCMAADPIDAMNIVRETMVN